MSRGREGSIIKKAISPWATGFRVPASECPLLGTGALSNDLPTPVFSGREPGLRAASSQPSGQRSP